MTLLQEHIKILEDDLVSEPMRISAYHDLPFAIFCYKPENEYELRKEAYLLARRLENRGKRIITISLAKLMWEAIEKARNISYIVETEKRFGFQMAQTTVNNILSKLCPLPVMLKQIMKDFDPERDIVFLTRAAALAPAVYRMSKLLDEMHGESILVPTILFYPGDKEGETELRFMSIEGREGISGYNYRVKMY